MSFCPTFPPELEREIFEICALSQPILIPKLMLVVQRVKDWVEPLLYRTMAMEYIPRDRGRPKYSMDAVLSAIRAKPPAFFPRAVRHLAFPFQVVSSGETRSPAEIILGVCTGIENLSMLDIPEALIPLVRSLPLKHLYAECGPLLSTLSTLSTLPPTHTFSRLTHLEVDFSYDDEVDLDNTCVALIALPQLTQTRKPVLPRCKGLASRSTKGVQGVLLTVLATS